jgi:hypothetical protein
MRYVMLIYEREAEWLSMSEEEQGKVFGEYMAFTDSIRKSGNYAGGEALQPTATATTVRVRDGRAKSMDGPFAETKEQLGGLYIIDAKDLDEAMAIAGRIPGAKYGSIEVRPVIDFSAPK